ncbi:S1C family serine protease [Planococcus halotolerans]|uniref:2-alkenal reductase n=1 Tax=Planococcus halotolerans TaxID=2233542 RepID=A0A365L6B9_9BACL|nr:trypsin-like peptidase domain-containing protein [Planococcus halotolerans]QHJ70314.1 PDZ domain-containing protein [Planococcus halotolerans]RAZ80956.1 2-alkenal reductase [Planococcus halotolerans]
MGYYNSTEPKKRNKGNFASGFTGILAGAVLAGVVLPGFTDIEQGIGEETQQVENVSGVENVSSIVTSDVTEVVDATSASVVGVTNLQTAKQNPFSQSGGSSEPQEAGAGSGVIYKKEGDSAYIVTNNHVVEGAEQVKVTLSDGTEIDAEVLGTDVWTDLAVLKTSSAEIKDVAEFGDSSVLKAGEPVIAIGNPLGLQFSGSVTTGVISGTERSIPIDINKDGTEDWQAEVLQTDAAINPGNSGGALINSQGQLIGINSMKIAQDAVEGIGLAIPINSAIPIIEDLEVKGEVERPALGVSILDLQNVPAPIRQNELNLPAELEKGVVVESVAKDSGAEAAGLQQSDVIVEMGGDEINSVLELRQYLYTKAEVGDTLKVKFYRGAELMEAEVQLTEGM